MKNEEHYIKYMLGLKHLGSLSVRTIQFVTLRLVYSKVRFYDYVTKTNRKDTIR